MGKFNKLKLILITTCVLMHFIDTSYGFYLPETILDHSNVADLITSTENTDSNSEILHQTTRPQIIESRKDEEEISQLNVSNEIRTPEEAHELVHSTAAPHVSDDELSNNVHSYQNVDQSHHLTNKDAVHQNNDETTTNLDSDVTPQVIKVVENVQNITREAKTVESSLSHETLKSNSEINQEIPQTTASPETTSSESPNKEAESINSVKEELHSIPVSEKLVDQNNFETQTVPSGLKLEESIRKDVRDEILSETPIDQNAIEVLQNIPNPELQEEIARDILGNDYIRRTELSANLDEFSPNSDVKYETIVEEAAHVIDSQSHDHNTESNNTDANHSTNESQVDHETTDLETSQSGIEISTDVPDFLQNTQEINTPVVEEEPKSIEEEQTTIEPVQNKIGREGRAMDSKIETLSPELTVEIEHELTTLIPEVIPSTESIVNSNEPIGNLNEPVSNSSESIITSNEGENQETNKNIDEKNEEIDGSGSEELDNEGSGSQEENIEFTTLDFSGLTALTATEKTRSISEEGELRNLPMKAIEAEEASVSSEENSNSNENNSLSGESDRVTSKPEGVESEVTTEPEINPKIEPRIDSQPEEPEQSVTVLPEVIENKETAVTSIPEVIENFENGTTAIPLIKEDVENIETVHNIEQATTIRPKEELNIETTESTPIETTIQPKVELINTELDDLNKKNKEKESSSSDSSDSSDSSEEEKPKKIKTSKKEKSDSDESNEAIENIKTILKPKGRSFPIDEVIELTDSTTEIPRLEQHTIMKKPSADSEFEYQQRHSTESSIQTTTTTEISLNPNFKIPLPHDETEKIPKLIFETTTLLPMRIFKSHSLEPVDGEGEADHPVVVTLNDSPRHLNDNLIVEEETNIVKQQPSEEEMVIRKIVETESTTRMISETFTEGVELGKEINKNMNLFLDTTEKNNKISTLNSENHSVTSDEVMAESNIAEALSNQNIKRVASTFNPTLVVLVIGIIAIMGITVLVVTFFRFRTPQGVLDIEMQERSLGKDSSDEEHHHNHHHNCCTTASLSTGGDDTISHTISCTSSSSPSSFCTSQSSSLVKRSLSNCTSTSSTSKQSSTLRIYEEGDEEEKERLNKPEDDKSDDQKLQQNTNEMSKLIPNETESTSSTLPQTKEDL